MKLLNFQFASGGAPQFGVVIKGYAVSFETLQQNPGKRAENLRMFIRIWKICRQAKTRPENF